MIAGQDVAEQQRHPHLGQGSHAGEHDPHPPHGNGPGKILTRYEYQLGKGLLVNSIGSVPSLTKLALLVLL